MHKTNWAYNVQIRVLISKQIKILDCWAQWRTVKLSTVQMWSGLSFAQEGKHYKVRKRVVRLTRDSSMLLVWAGSYKQATKANSYTDTAEKKTERGRERRQEGIETHRTLSKSFSQTWPNFQRWYLNVSSASCLSLTWRLLFVVTTYIRFCGNPQSETCLFFHI